LSIEAGTIPISEPAVRAALSLPLPGPPGEQAAVARRRARRIGRFMKGLSKRLVVARL
jgi:hypothetical protein